MRVLNWISIPGNGSTNQDQFTATSNGARSTNRSFTQNRYFGKSSRGPGPWVNSNPNMSEESSKKGPDYSSGKWRKPPVEIIIGEKGSWFREENGLNSETSNGVACRKFGNSNFDSEPFGSDAGAWVGSISEAASRFDDFRKKRDGVIDINSFSDNFYKKKVGSEEEGDRKENRKNGGNERRDKVGRQKRTNFEFPRSKTMLPSGKSSFPQLDGFGDGSKMRINLFRKSKSKYSKYLYMSD